MATPTQTDSVLYHKTWEITRLNGFEKYVAYNHSNNNPGVAGSFALIT